jgi:radical SAM protein with 4Fe4S-binding SPASM domain
VCEFMSLLFNSPDYKELTEREQWIAEWAMCLRCPDHFVCQTKCPKKGETTP